MNYLVKEQKTYNLIKPIMKDMIKLINDFQSFVFSETQVTLNMTWRLVRNEGTWIVLFLFLNPYIINISSYYFNEVFMIKGFYLVFKMMAVLDLNTLIIEGRCMNEIRDQKHAATQTRVGLFLL